MQGRPERSVTAKGPTDARALFALRGNPRSITAVRQAPDGDYPRRNRFEASRDDLAAHFAGAFTLALVCRDADYRSWFFAFDLDERASERLRVLGAILEDRGFGPAMIATTGSDPERGKLIVFLDSPQPRDGLRELAADVLAEARAKTAWGIEQRPKQAVSAFPQTGFGGLLRLGGRNSDPARNGPVEQFFDPVTGERAYLSGVRPSGLLRLEPAAQQVPVAPQLPFVAKWMATGWEYGDAGTPGVLNRIRRLAHEAHRLYGDAGKPAFKAWLAAIQAKSPGLAAPSPTTRDRRNIFGRAEAIWRAVCQKRAQCHTTQPPQIAGGNLCSVAPVLEMLKAYVEKRGLDPGAFAISYRELMYAVGDRHAKTTHRKVQRLVELGLIVILDRGTQGTRGADKTIYALPEAAKPDHHMVIARKEKHARYADMQAAKVTPLRRFVAAKATLPGSHGAGDPQDAGEYDPTARRAETDESLLGYALRRLPSVVTPPQ